MPIANWRHSRRHSLSDVLYRFIAVHRLPVVRAGVRRVRDASRGVDDPSRYVDRPEPCRPARTSACTAMSRPAPSLSGRRHQEERGRRRAIALKPRCIACSNCVLACPFGVPKMG